MEATPLRRAVFLFLGLVVAYLVAAGISAVILSRLGPGGPAGAVVGFLLFALLFFLILRLIERITGMDFFVFHFG